MDVAILDHCAATRRVLAWNLELEGHWNRIVGDGTQPYSDESESVDLVILDLMLPRDGAFRILENRPRWMASACVLGVSTCPLQSDRRRALDCGVSRYATAPFSLRELLNWIAEVEARRGSETVTGLPARPDRRPYGRPITAVPELADGSNSLRK